nr:agamous-like MADS-box protein AGL62 [Tanacetum cinerariifolium]
MNKKTGQGRKKIKIKKIEEKNNRLITFSKRRNGLFKKAAELCVLTGAKITIIVKSTGGRIFAEFWFDEPIDGMDVGELEEYLSSLQELKTKVLNRADELRMINNALAFFGLNLNNNTPIQDVLQGVQGHGPNVMHGLNGPNELQHLKGHGPNVTQECSESKVVLTINLVDAIAWWIDSGATTHVCKDHFWFKKFERVEDGSVDAIAWWIDSGATTHVCKDHFWFKKFERVEDGSVLYMGDE